MDMALIKSLGALIDVKPFGTIVTQTAGATASITGLTVDRMGQSTGSLARVLDLAVYYSAALTAGRTLSLQVTLNHSQNGTIWTPLYSEAVQLLVTAGSTATYTGIFRLTVNNSNYPNVYTGADNPSTPWNGFNLPANVAEPSVYLGSAARYLQAILTPTLSNTATDTVALLPLGIFAGYDILQAPIG
jgi:hypothetical protein